jgi:parallel beta-helix repeat protein
VLLVPLVGDRMAAIILLLILVSLAVSITEVNVAKAEFNGIIIIGADGSVSPSTAPLKQAGNVYSLTEDVKGKIIVNNNNLVLDGKNHTLTPPSISDYGISLDGVSNVTVTRFKITGGAIGIEINGTLNTVANNTIKYTDNGIYAIEYPTAAIALHDASSNIITMNNLENNTVGIILVSYHSGQCRNNLIFENNVKNCKTAIGIYDSSNNRFYHNNFFNNKIMLRDNGYYAYGLPSFNIWDDGCQFGNYWSDYLLRYPNATEINHTGVGDTPYFVKPNPYVDPSTLSRQEAIDYWTDTNAQYEINTDNFPLMEPVEMGGIPKFPSWTILPLFLIATLSVIVFRKKLVKTS